MAKLLFVVVDLTYGGEGSIEILIKLADEAHSPMQIAEVDFDAVLVRLTVPLGGPSLLPARGTEPTGFASRLHCMQKSTLPGASACNGGEGSIEILIKLADEAYSPMQIAVVYFDAVLVRRNAYNGVPSVLPARGTEPRVRPLWRLQ
jgi:hypothetical protein